MKESIATIKQVAESLQKQNDLVLATALTASIKKIESALDASNAYVDINTQNENKMNDNSNNHSNSNSNKSKKNVDINISDGGLTRDVLINGKWQFFTDGGYAGDMKLLKNGTIEGHNTKNERTWKLSNVKGNHHILEFFGDNDRKTCQFLHAVKCSTGKWKLQGPYNHTAWKHYLIQQ